MYVKYIPAKIRMITQLFLCVSFKIIFHTVGLLENYVVKSNTEAHVSTKNKNNYIYKYNKVRESI